MTLDVWIHIYHVLLVGHIWHDVGLFELSDGYISCYSSVTEAKQLSLCQKSLCEKRCILHKLQVCDSFASAGTHICTFIALFCYCTWFSGLPCQHLLYVLLNIVCWPVLLCCYWIVLFTSSVLTWKSRLDIHVRVWGVFNIRLWCFAVNNLCSILKGRATINTKACELLLCLWKLPSRDVDKEKWCFMVIAYQMRNKYVLSPCENPATESVPLYCCRWYCCPYHYSHIKTWVAETSSVHCWVLVFSSV